jgi:nitrogen fixation NifU-like protein
VAFSPETIRRFRSVAHKGLSFKPDGLGLGGSFESGRYVLIAIRCQAGVVGEARFESYNCLPAIAAADWVCETLTGLTAAQALELDAKRIASALGGLPPSRMFCASLVHLSMTQAITDAQRKGRLP